MEVFKIIVKKLKKPSLPLVILSFLLVVVFSTVAIISAVSQTFGIIAYPIYALAAIFLGYGVYIIVRFAPTFKMRVTLAVKKNRYLKVFLEDFGLRTLFTATCSGVVNIAFVAFNGIMCFITKIGWYGALAVYYLLLGGIRIFVFFKDRRTKRIADGKERVIKKLKDFRACGIAVFILEIAMAVAVTLMVFDQKPTVYSEIIAIAFAAYTFYKVGLSVLNIVKATRHDDTAVKAFRNVGILDGAVSLLSLQTALISTFSSEGGASSQSDMFVLNALIGALVCLFTIGIGVNMIVWANKKIKEQNNGR